MFATPDPPAQGPICVSSTARARGHAPKRHTGSNRRHVHRCHRGKHKFTQTCCPITYMQKHGPPNTLTNLNGHERTHQAISRDRPNPQHRKFTLPFTQTQQHLPALHHHHVPINGAEEPTEVDLLGKTNQIRLLYNSSRMVKQTKSVLNPHGC